MNMNRIDQLKKILDRKIQSAQGIVNKFAADLASAKVPLSVMESSRSVFAQSAVLLAYGQALGFLNTDTRDNKYEILMAHAIQEMARGAKYPEMSTNPCANLAGTYKTVAWAELHELMTELAEDE